MSADLKLLFNMTELFIKKSKVRKIFEGKDKFIMNVKFDALEHLWLHKISSKRQGYMTLHTIFGSDLKTIQI